MRSLGWGVAAALLVSGCSFQAALDKMVDPARQREIVDIAQRICTDPDSVRTELHPEIATSIDQAKAALPRECPGAGANWQLASYQWKANTTPQMSERQEEVVVVGSKDGKWSTIEMRFYAQNDQPLQITLWHILASDKPPPALDYIDSYNQTAKVITFVGPAIAIAAIGAVAWMFRRRRAKRAA